METKKRILVVDDDRDALRATSILLRHKGYHVLTAGTFSEAMTICDNEQFDLLVSDLTLPDGDGCDLMRAVAAKCGVKGIACTGYGMEEDITRCNDAGFAEHLTKPIDIETLFQTIERVV